MKSIQNYLLKKNLSSPPYEKHSELIVKKIKTNSSSPPYEKHSELIVKKKLELAAISKNIRN